MRSLSNPRLCKPLMVHPHACSHGSATSVCANVVPDIGWTDRRWPLVLNLCFEQPLPEAQVQRLPLPSSFLYPFVSMVVETSAPHLDHYCSPPLRQQCLLGSPQFLPVQHTVRPRTDAYESPVTHNTCLCRYISFPACKCVRIQD